MFALSDTRTTWIGYALLLGLLAAVAYGGLAAQALDTDDFEYLRDAAAASQDLSLLFSTDRSASGLCRSRLWRRPLVGRRAGA